MLIKMDLANKLNYNNKMNAKYPLKHIRAIYMILCEISLILWYKRHKLQKNV